MEVQPADHKLSSKSNSLRVILPVRSLNATLHKDFYPATTHNGTCAQIPTVQISLQCQYKRLADLQNNGLAQLLIETNDRLACRTVREFTRRSLLSRGIWKEHHSGAKSRGGKSVRPAQCCTPNNKAAGTAMSAMSFNGEITASKNSLTCFGVQFHRTLTYQTQVESTKLRCREGLPVPKAMAAKGINSF